MTERYAPEGAVWVCAACGKTAKDRHGYPGAADRGWDESCMLNAVLCREDSLQRRADGRVAGADAFTAEAD